MACTASCSLEAEDSTFTGNFAAQGGVLFSSTMFSKSTLSRCSLQGNTATLAGGALFSTAGRLYLSNQTMVKDNTAPTGISSFVVGGDINYALPAPIGFFASATYCKLYRLPCSVVPCDPSTRPPLPDQPCTPDEYGRYLSRLPRGALEDSLPYRCPPGVYGSSLGPTGQMSAQCSGPCPAGYYCPAGTSVPTPCSIGTYCSTGSPLESACVSGHHENARIVSTDAAACALDGAHPSRHQLSFTHQLICARACVLRLRARMARG